MASRYWLSRRLGSVGRGVAVCGAEEELLECVARHEQPATEAHGGDLALSRSLIRQPA
jgi:hypothetical protein